MTQPGARRFDVTVAGELNLDLVLYGLPEELTPERELIASDMVLTLGSSSAIFAHNLAALGNRVGFISRLGNDPLGEIALEKLREPGVDISCVRRSNDGTGSGLTVILHRGNWRNILTYLGTISQLAYEDLNLDYLCAAKHFHFSSLFLQAALQPRVPELLKNIKAAGLTISLDTNDDPDDKWQAVDEALPYVDVLLPNKREALKISGAHDLETAIARLAEIVPLVVVKLGPEGAIAQRGKQRFQAAPVKVEATDPIGAGDSFDAGFLTQFVRGADIENCLSYGNLAGALSTTRPGGTEAFRDVAHRERFLQQYQTSQPHSARD